MGAIRKLYTYEDVPMPRDLLGRADVERACFRPTSNDRQPWLFQYTPTQNDTKNCLTMFIYFL